MLGVGELRTHPHLAGRDSVVGVDAQFFDGQWSSLAQLGGQQHADCPQKLQLRLGGGDTGQVAIQVVHGQGEDFLLTALLLTYLRGGGEDTVTSGQGLGKHSNTKGERRVAEGK